MDSHNRGQDHGFPIAQAQKIGLLQVVFPHEDAWNPNDKPSDPPSLITSNYFYYFDTVLILSQKLTFPWKPKPVT